MAGELITGNGQLQWRNTLLGTSTLFGTDSIEGLYDLPAQRGGNSPLPSRHGSYPGQRLSGERIITWNFKLSRCTLEQFRVASALLRHITAPGENPEEEDFAVQLDGQPLYAKARLLRRSIPTDKNYNLGYVAGALAWECTDPRLYSITEMSDTATLPVVLGGGLDFGSGGLDFGSGGLDFGAGTTGGKLTANVGGDVPTWPRFEIKGPVLGPQITYSGRTLAFDPTWEVPDGSTVIIDTAPRYLSVEMSGVSQRQRLFLAQWTPFLPGVATQVTFAAQAYSATAELKAFWRNAVH